CPPARSPSRESATGLRQGRTPRVGVHSTALRRSTVPTDLDRAPNHRVPRPSRTEPPPSGDQRRRFLHERGRSRQEPECPRGRGALAPVLEWTGAAGGWQYGQSGVAPREGAALREAASPCAAASRGGVHLASSTPRFFV